MKLKDRRLLKKYLRDLNKNISDIENQRFIVSVKRIPIIDSVCIFRIYDTLMNERIEHKFRWFVLRGVNNQIYYPSELLTWINNSIVAKRNF